MKVATRLNLAVLPAIVGLGVLAALAYWGDRGRQAPEVVVALALVATLGSAVLSWRSTRFVSRRVGDLAQAFRALGLNVVLSDVSDEFEELARVRESVRTLANDQARLRDTAAAAVRKADTDRRLHDAVLEQVATAVASRLEEARLALHILQTSPFGELNENQEELVSAARAATDEADRDVRRFARLVSMPARRRAATRESVSMRTLLEPVLAMLASATDASGSTLVVELPPTLPPVLVDRLATQEALSLVLPAIAARLQPADELRLSAEEGDGHVSLVAAPGIARADQTALSVLLARALIDAQPGVLGVADAAVRVQLPLTPSGVWGTAARSVHG
jgi:C4-dicarboxylate-specific signal transduction histidine kinase